MFLTADAFGVLPPISRLTREQAAYHFISGYTAKLAGTEIGVKEPTATFSAGFGAPFLPRHPGEYAAMLIDRLERYDVPVWLVNTGWTGGPYGTGERMNIAHTRNMVRAALNGELERRGDRRPTRSSGVAVPVAACRASRTRSSRRAATWADTDAYDAAARKLATMFHENFAPYADGVSHAVRDARPASTVHDGPGDMRPSSGPGPRADSGTDPARHSPHMPLPATPLEEPRAMARNKVTVIGAGNVGATTAQRIAEAGLADVVARRHRRGAAPGQGPRPRRGGAGRRPRRPDHSAPTTTRTRRARTSSW